MLHAQSAPEDGTTNPATAMTPEPLSEALLCYCRELGRVVSREELVAGLPVASGDLPTELVPRALQRLGLVGRVYNAASLATASLPACVRIKDGSWQVVLSQVGQEYTVADLSLQGAERRIACTILNAACAGEIIEALPDIADLQRRHTGEAQTGHWFWSTFTRQQQLIRDVVLGTFVANLLAIAVSLFALQVYDRVIPHSSLVTLWVLVAGATVAIVCEGLLRIARSHLIDASGRRIELEVSAMLFARLQGMQLAARGASPGALSQLMREFSSVREFFTTSSVGLAADIPFVLVFLLLIYAIAGPVVWVIAAAMLLIIIPSLLARGRMLKLSQETLGSTTAASKLLMEVCYHHEDVKSLQAERFFQRKWEELLALNADKTSQQRMLAARLTFWGMGVQQAAYVGAITTGVYLVLTGEFTVGTIIAVSILTSRSLAPITQLSGVIARWQQVKIALDGLSEIGNSEQDRPAERTFARRSILHGNIVLNGVTMGYHPQSPPAIKINWLQVDAGSTLALLGVNGSGKSTLLKLLSGLYPPTTGEVTIDGLDTRGIDPADLRTNIAYLPQEISMFAGTLRDNLLLGNPSLPETSLFAALDFAGVGEHIRHHPRGLDMPIADGGAGLSVGQRQSVGIARVFLQDPRIVLLDEPTASLDQNLENKVIGNLQEWLAERTCILSTHRVGILSLADNIAVINKGTISVIGPRDEVIQKLQPNATGPGSTAAESA